MQKNYFRLNCMDQTELETVSEPFCVEDSKSNHEQKQTSYISRKNVSYVKVIILCSNFILFKLGF